VRKILLTVLSILVVILFGWIDFIQHNWYPSEENSTINTIIITSFLVSIIGRLIKINWITFLIVIVSDITLVLYSYPGVAYGNLISSIVDSFNLAYPKHVIVVILGLSIFILDWKNHYLTIKQRN
jgi:hypothetical protein